MNDTPIRCERVTSCQFNNGGVCSLKDPIIDKRRAYASCLDQKLPVVVE